MSLPSTMDAVAIDIPGGVDTLQLSKVDVPKVAPGQVLVKVEYTTVITSELATRQGVSTALLPLILGNEFVGTIVASPDDTTRIGTRVIGGYGGYGYTRNGAWATYICVDAADAFPVQTSLDSRTLAAIPASFTAAAGSLRSLGDLSGRSLFIRGGTSGVGLAAATMALAQGATVIASSRDASKKEKLLAHGVHHVVVDDGTLVEQIHAIMPFGVDLALEMLGVSGLSESLKSVRPFGTVCLTGILNDQAVSMKTALREDRSVPGYPHPMELIPPTVRLTIGGVDGTPRTPELVQGWVDNLESGVYRMPIDSVFSFEDIASAHKRRADHTCFGKVLLRVDDTPA